MATAKLRSARIAAKDLLSTYPKAQGSLETDIANAFGLTLDTNITASAFSFDNAGRVTKDLVEQSADSEAVNAGIGKQITNSSNSKVVQLMQSTAGTSHLFSVRDASSPLPGSGTPQPTRFGIDMATGGLTGSTTQDTVQTPLIPQAILPGSGPLHFYNAQGQFAVPVVQSLPFYGVKLSPVALPLVDTSAYISWTEDLDVGDHFSSADPTKIYCVATGKFYVSVTLAFTSNTPANGMWASFQIESNSGADYGSADFRIPASSALVTGSYLQASGTISMTAGNYVRVFCSGVGGTGVQVNAGYDGGLLSGGASSGKRFHGSLVFFRVE